MKKIGILNQPISEVIAGMGHTDMLVIGDAGLPVPRGIRRIDLAVKPGLPGFVETVTAIAEELGVERIVLAEETESVSPQISEQLTRIFPNALVDRVSHDRLKELCREVAAVVRTGEFTPYANVILVAGVSF